MKSMSQDEMPWASIETAKTNQLFDGPIIRVKDDEGHICIAQWGMYDDSMDGPLCGWINRSNNDSFSTGDGFESILNFEPTHWQILIGLDELIANGRSINIQDLKE